MRNIKFLFSSQNLKWVLLALGVVGFLLYSWYKKFKSVSGANDARNDSTKVYITVNTTETALRLHQTIHGNPFSENEETFVSIIKGLPKSVIPEIAIRYNEIDGFNLYADAIKYLSSSQYESIQNILV